MNKLVRITDQDMVAVALAPLAAGEAVSWGAGEIAPLTDIPMGHKVALRDIAKGEAVIKYGYPIGSATEDIPAGGHVHTPVLRFGAGNTDAVTDPEFLRSRADITAQVRAVIAVAASGA